MRRGNLYDGKAVPVTVEVRVLRSSLKCESVFREHRLPNAFDMNQTVRVQRRHGDALATEWRRRTETTSREVHPKTEYKWETGRLSVRLEEHWSPRFQAYL